MASVIRSVQRFKNVSLRLPAELADKIDTIRENMKALPEMEFPFEELLLPQITKLVTQCEEEISAHVPDNVLGAATTRRRGRGREKEATVGTEPAASESEG